jgi:NTE family protein
MQGKFNNKTKHTKPTQIGIALQGGGSYGAYAKGALKALLRSEFNARTNIAAITGTSAGALNGAMLAYGLNKGGADDAIKHLDGLWDDVKLTGSAMSFWHNLGPLTNLSWPNIPQHKMMMFSFAQAALPQGIAINALKDSVNAQIDDFDILRNGKTALFVNAVKHNKVTQQREHTVFHGNTLNAESIIASGALESLGGIEINGDTYYDGAYWRNPCFADIKRANISDLFVITLQAKPTPPIVAQHQDDARTKGHRKIGYELITHEIHGHLAHIHHTNPALNLHVISLEPDPRWNDTSRMNTDPTWLNHLEDLGKKDAQQWLAVHLDDLGKKSTYKPDHGSIGGTNLSIKP